MTNHASLKGSSPVSNHNEIAKQAHKLWIEAGQPHGRDEDFWLAAEKYWWHSKRETVPLSSSNGLRANRITVY
ncbi:DUF2934 domain-containing protein [Coraliomargarita sp. W4R53]